MRLPQYIHITSLRVPPPGGTMPVAGWRKVGKMLRLLAFTLPLCLDNFAIAFAVLGEIRLTRAQLVRVTVVFIAFEAIMPLIGLALGAPLIHLIAGPPHINIDPYQP